LKDDKKNSNQGKSKAFFGSSSEESLESRMKSTLLTQSDILSSEKLKSEEEFLIPNIRQTLINKAYDNAQLNDNQRKSIKPVIRSSLADQEINDRYPAIFALAVAIDAFLDGLFIGITYSASEETGDPTGVFVLALSISIESICLGSTFSLAIPKSSSLKTRFLSFLIGPLIMFTTSFIGAEIGIALLNYPTAFQESRHLERQRCYLSQAKNC
jgi:zinc transporter ZupT